MTSLLSRRSKLAAFALVALPLTTLLSVSCTGDDMEDLGNGGAGGAGKSGAAGASHGGVSGTAGASHGGSAGTSQGGSNSAGAAGSESGGQGGGSAGQAGLGGDGGLGGESGQGGAGGLGGEAGLGGGGAAQYDGPSVGKAQTFAALAYSAITTANISTIVGDLGVSAGAVSTITGFDAASYVKYGTDSLVPNSQRTILAQQDVTALVGNIDPRACDTDLTNVVGGLTGDITLHPGVTCMNSFSADVLINGHVYLDAGHDPNAFFIIKGNLTLTVADGAEVVLQNGAQACGVFWRISKQVTIGKTVKFFGTVIAGTAITMNTGSTLNGRALAQTAGVQLDANSITIPASCTHVQ
ncbi:MAG TPA: ice-binding family protein [Polyangiaceae bacterium]|nr:ice-binding family protein [Polyangiaceae bacterium]